MVSLAYLASMLMLYTWVAEGHHPVGIPQYRDHKGDMVMIYNVITEDFIVRFQARPGRPVAGSGEPVELQVRIVPKDPALTFEGGTYLSIVEDRGNEGESEVMAPVRKTDLAGERQVETAFSFDHAGRYVVKIDFVESPGREVLSFPVPVDEMGGPSSRRALGLALGGGVLLILLILARKAGLRRRRAGMTDAS